MQHITLPIAQGYIALNDARSLAPSVCSTSRGAAVSEVPETGHGAWGLKLLRSGSRIEYEDERPGTPALTTLGLRITNRFKFFGEDTDPTAIAYPISQQPRGGHLGADGTGG